MTQERWRQIEELYHKALECPSGRRSAFLAEACKADRELQRHIELLLAEDPAPGNFPDYQAADVLPELLTKESVAQLPAGTRLGPYRIESILGRGGMGQVYRAHDPRMGRDVAIKLSAERFSDRFECEVRAVAAMNHANICQVYDVGHNFLVMELIEGPTLSERIKAGAVPLDEALAIARQISDALEAAHEKGIIHRDLKPANIKIKSDGSVKVLDFGLAKLTPVAEHRSPQETPTMPMGRTVKGEILGTAAYMSPEQARGQAIDKRADIWAFGVVLYEMVCGRGPFRRDTFTDTLAAVVNDEPDWTGVPAKVRRLLRACLEKDARQRLRDIGDARQLLDDAPSAAVPAAPKRLWWIMAAIALAAGGGGWLIASRSARSVPPESPIARFTIPPPENVSYRPGVISPDGRWFAFIGVDALGKSQLWVRRLDSLSAQPLAEAESWPFWSPDSRFIGFLQKDKLMKIEPSGGTPQTVCRTNLVIGASWSRQGNIIFGKSDVIMGTTASGGEPKQITRLNAERKETAHDFPFFLPDGSHFLYVIRSAKRENGGIYLGSLDSPDVRIRLLTDISNPWYVPESPRDPAAGYLLFARGQALMAQRFSARNFQLQGDAFLVLETISRSGSNLSASFSASDNGVLVTSPTYMGEQLTWFDRKGRQSGTIGTPGLHLYPQISPDGQTLADDPTDPETFAPYIWLFPITKGAPALFTFTPSDRPIWSGDGTRIAYGHLSSALYAKTAVGLENEELVLEAAHIPEQTAGDEYRQPCDWSKDGRFLLFIQKGEAARYSLWTMPMFGDRKPGLLLRSDFNILCGALSPDGRWIAYASDDHGRNELYVQAFGQKAAGGARKWQVSYQGGSWPKWRRDGKELFFLDADRKMVAVDVLAGATFEHGAPQTLFDTGIMTPDSRFDVTADGRRFIIPTAISNGSAPATVVVNWTKGAPR